MPTPPDANQPKEVQILRREAQITFMRSLSISDKADVKQAALDRKREIADNSKTREQCESEYGPPHTHAVIIFNQSPAKRTLVRL